MNKKIIASAVTLLSIPTLAIADDAEPKGPITGEGAFTYVLSNGNTEDSNLGGNLKLIHDGAYWRTTLTLNGVNKKADNQRTGEKYYGALQLDRKLDEVSYVFVIVDHEVDRFSGYESESSVSLGYGRTLIENDAHKLTVEIGPGYRVGKLRATGEKVDSAMLRGAMAYEWNISDTSIFVQDFSVEAGEEFTVFKSLTALKTKVSDQIALTVGYDIKHNSEPGPTSKKTDTTFYTSLGYTF